ncbi:MAG: hypothetical protein CMN76_01745 [Spirochaetaceae bacterium]|nr:hypothetical protein [Spirochaetaceae bacterium]
MIRSENKYPLALRIFITVILLFLGLGVGIVLSDLILELRSFISIRNPGYPGLIVYIAFCLAPLAYWFWRRDSIRWFSPGLYATLFVLMHLNPFYYVFLACAFFRECP